MNYIRIIQRIGKMGFLIIILFLFAFKANAQLDGLGFPINYLSSLCNWSYERNQYNRPAKGSLTYANYSEWEYKLIPVIPPYFDLVEYKYYYDEAGCKWRKESIEENAFHGEGTVKFTRMDRNGKGSHETVIVLQDGESYESNEFSGIRQLNTGRQQQTYNFYDNHENPFLHALYDVEPHITCTGDYLSYPVQYDTPYEWDEIPYPSGIYDVVNSFEIPIVGSMDPNDIVGPRGFAEQQWVSKDEVLPYTIRFENDPDSATAPAQKVVINLQIDPKLGASRLQFGIFGFGNFIFSNAMGASNYKKRLDVLDSVGVYVDIEFKIDQSNNVATWTFQSIDPNTGLPPRDPYAGFLPLNDTLKHNGEGFVSFTIKPKQTVQTGDLINALADIIFDYNDPIVTNDWINTVDASPPESNVNSNITSLDSNAYNVSWMGDDTDNGSGLKDYNIYYSDSSGIINKWIENTTINSAIFYGEYGNSYQFYSTSRDNVNNIEARPDIYDAVLEVDNNTGIENLRILNDNLLSIYPNPTECCFRVVSDLNCTSTKTIIVYNTTGKKIIEKQFNSKEISIDLSNNAKGLYYVNVICDNKQANGKIVIQ